MLSQDGWIGKGVENSATYAELSVPSEPYSLSSHRPSTPTRLAQSHRRLERFPSLPPDFLLLLPLRLSLPANHPYSLSLQYLIFPTRRLAPFRPPCGWRRALAVGVDRVVPLGGDGVASCRVRPGNGRAVRRHAAGLRQVDRATDGRGELVLDRVLDRRRRFRLHRWTVLVEGLLLVDQRSGERLSTLMGRRA